LQGACIRGKIIFYFIMRAHANTVVPNIFLQLLPSVAGCAGHDNYVIYPRLQATCIRGKIIFYSIMHAHANTIILNLFLQLSSDVA
jgi:hypothetical protein